MTPLTPLCEIARECGTDKGGWHLKAGDTCHVYTPVYYDLFKDRRERVRRVLEIGVNHGCSLRMWEAFFTNAEVIGLDINPGCLFNANRIKCFAADQNNGDSLWNAMMQLTGGHPIPKFDVIVDDGSHLMEHQVFSANFLLPHLADDGIYVIEDIDYDCQPWTIGDQINPAFKWHALECGVGLGNAHCHPQCRKCCGLEGEQLLVIQHG